MSRFSTALTAIGGLALLAAAGCTTDHRMGAERRGDPSANRSQASVQKDSMAPAYYRTHDTASYGRVYVNADGQALYVYARDRRNQSTCYGTCARQWQPYLASGEARGDGQWSVIDRTDGTRQWAYDGRPTYMWSGDREPGAVTGHGRNGWSVMRASQR